MTQARLFGADAPALHVSPAIALNRSVHSVEAPRLRRQCYAILDRLRQGPASNRELADLSGSLNFRARISEARQAGFDIRIIERDRATGRVVYALVSESGAHTHVD